VDERFRKVQQSLYDYMKQRGRRCPDRFCASPWVEPAGRRTGHIRCAVL